MSALARCPPIAGNLTLRYDGTLITWPYTPGGRSRRGSPKAGTTVQCLVIASYYSVSLIMSATSSAKKRKLDIERRAFNPAWNENYFFMERVGQAQCLILCLKTVAVLRELVSFVTPDRELFWKVSPGLRSEKVARRIRT